MKVLHVIPSVSPVDGGPSYAMPLIARTLAGLGVDVDVATTDDDGPGLHLDVEHGKRVEASGYGIRYFRKQSDFYKVSLPFRRWIRRHVGDYDVVHIHAMFSYLSNCAARAARQSNVPYVVRPLGVLNRWGIKNRRPLLKSLSLRFIEEPILERAAAIHYTSGQERIEAEQGGAVSWGVILPLGIDLAPFQKLPDQSRFWQRFPIAARRPLVLFLSRIDPKKGLDLLLEAFRQVLPARPDALLIVAGDGDKSYVESLVALAQRLQIEDSVVWTGRLDGEEKMSAFAAASVFVLPSHSENFGIAAVEALAAGLPVILGEGVAISADVQECEAGLVVRPDAGAVARAIMGLLGDPALRSRCAGNGRRLVHDKFSLEAMGQGLVSLYEKVRTQWEAREGCEGN